MVSSTRPVPSQSPHYLETDKFYVLSFVRCMSDDRSWHMCVPKWATNSDTYGYRTPSTWLDEPARVTGSTVGSLLDSLEINQPDKNSDNTNSTSNSNSNSNSNSTSAQVSGTVQPKVVVDPPVMTGPVVISEFMASNENTFEDEDGSFPDWIEIQNISPDEIDLKGWHMSDEKEQPNKFTFPSVSLESQGFLVLFASGKNSSYIRSDDKQVIHTNFKLESKGGYIGLTAPDGEVSSEFKAYPPQYEDVSYGKAGNKLLNFIRNSENEQDDASDFGYLQTATPNSRNSFLKIMGPAIFDVTENPEERPQSGKDFAITATVYAEDYGDIDVSLHTRTNFLQEGVIRMTPSAESNEAGGVVYTGVISGQNLRVGSLLRWYVTAFSNSGRGQVTRSPEVKAMDEPQYFGTVVRSSSEGSNGLPVMQLFAASASAATSESGARGSLFYDGRLYDNVSTRRRGQTTMSWKKPKLKVDFKGKVFKFAEGEKKVEEFNLQSHFFELGSQTYSREDIAAQVIRESGVPTPIVFPLDLWLNGKYYGLYSFVEQIDDQFLKRNHYSTAGPLYKAWHIWKSNLRWDIKAEDMQWAYRKGNLKDVKVMDEALGGYLDLANFTLGLVGKGKKPDDWSRTSYLFNHVDIPEVVNEMAAQALIINQDRLTKNYYVYFNPETDEWLRFPWDLEAAFGVSGKLGGSPSEHYCVLACEQFNSPLFGDSEHPQDIRDFYDGGRWNRRLQFLFTPPSYGGGYGRSSSEPEFECKNPGADGTGCFKDKSPRYADGTFNYLYDAILDVDLTRQMYLRRLRTLMDFWLNGRIEELVTEHYKKVRRSAKMDNVYWQTGDIDEGYEQLMTEQLPTRREQLYEEYGPTGSGLIPHAQKEKPLVEIANVQYPTTEADLADYVEVSNLENVAVDISGWKLDGEIEFKFQPGTVIPSQYSVFVCRNVLACKQRSSGNAQNPRFVQGPFEGELPLKGSKESKKPNLKLFDSAEQLMHQK